MDRLIDEGGDWDRRNRLKVYNGVYLISIRQFKRGGELLLDALSTFTATELLSYNDFVALTVIANTLTLKRVDLKKRVRHFGFLDRSCSYLHIFSSSSQPLKSTKCCLNFLCWVILCKTCTTATTTSFLLLSVSPLVMYRVKSIDNASATLEQKHLIPSRILSPHARYYVREMRILAYSQLLESYRSLTIESLSAAFGVTVEFMDR